LTRSDSDAGASEEVVTSRADSEVRRHVEAELFCCPDLDETDIAVKVTNGTVTLTGYVRSFFDKFGAEDAVKRVPGVAAVANNIEVQPRGAAGISDPEIARAAVTAIRQALPACWEQVRPVVRRGAVTLEGALDWIYQRDLAEGAVRDLRGVACVINAISLTPRPRVTDT
jgi:osmotically-inducible protein OsmY